MPLANTPNSAANPYWSRTADELAATLGSGPAGLSTTEAESRLAADGPNRIGKTQSASGLVIFLRQFASPLVLILVFAAIVSAFTGELQEAAIIAFIILASCVLSFTQE